MTRVQEKAMCVKIKERSLKKKPCFFFFARVTQKETCQPRQADLTQLKVRWLSPKQHY